MKQIRKFKLSDKRQSYTDNRDGILIGEPMRPNARYIQRQSDEVVKMVERMEKDVAKAVKALFKTGLAKESVAMDASITSQAIILLNTKAKEWQKKFNIFSGLFSNDMVASQTKSVTRDTRTTLEKLSGGLSIKADTMSQRTKDIARASAEQSASLIKSIAPDAMGEIKESVMRSITDGTSSFAELQKSIDDSLTGRFKKYKNKAKNVTQDQIRKTYQSLSDQRMRDVGVTKYKWLHTGGSVSPRSYHKFVLNGQIFDLNDPPVIDPKTGVKGNPGDLIHCHCVKVPVITFG
jgi:hypothetical protein